MTTPSLQPYIFLVIYYYYRNYEKYYNHHYGAIQPLRNKVGERGNATGWRRDGLTISLYSMIVFDKVHLGVRFVEWSL